MRLALYGLLWRGWLLWPLAFLKGLFPLRSFSFRCYCFYWFLLVPWAQTHGVVRNPTYIWLTAPNWHAGRYLTIHNTSDVLVPSPCRDWHENRGCGVSLLCGPRFVVSHAPFYNSYASFAYRLFLRVSPFFVNRCLFFFFDTAYKSTKEFIQMNIGLDWDWISQWS